MITKQMKLILRVLIVVVAALLLLGGGGYLWLRRSLPVTSGSLTVAGIGAPVTIVRDGNGIPHITGESASDAVFGLGYAHAQDRLWQMEWQRRLASGRSACWPSTSCSSGATAAPGTRSCSAPALPPSLAPHGPPSSRPPTSPMARRSSRG